LIYDSFFARADRADQVKKVQGSPQESGPTGGLTTARADEPKKLRYRLLHVTAKITPTARTTTLRIAAACPGHQSHRQSTATTTSHRLMKDRG
jgi:hypothetical protein